MHHAISAPNAAAPGQLVAMAVDEAPPVWVAAARQRRVGAHEGFDLVAAAAPGVAAAVYEEVGATLLLESCGYDRDRLDGPPA